ncbi:hypothetical protein SLS62_001836 [Diatrype stigma]|uniref:Uncharacterized protein n=1 Tax=Diatrype stigma TaxID=117547 RepID=A0AAN9YVK2_9PEZI
MILSGGLGSSRYVRDRIQHALMKIPHPHAHQIQILQAPDPQLVVVKGLLLDRLQKLDSGNAPVIVSRIARASYGFECKAKYNPAIHLNERVQRDPYDGELYVMGQIDWLIMKGDQINTNSAVSSTFTKKIEHGSSNRTFDSVIITSDLDRHFLPTSTSQPGVRQLCIVKSNLAGIHNNEMTMKRKEKKMFFIKGRKYHLCTFEVKAIIAPADIRFELWFGGQKFSKNHEPIQINWDTEGPKNHKSGVW